MINRIILFACMLAFMLPSPSYAQVTASPELKDWRSTGQFFNFNGQQIFYHDTNTPHNQVILMLHGFPTSSWDWRHLWQALGDNYRLVSLDMLGFGFSDKPKHKRYSIYEQADLQLALLEKLGIKRFHILAHDYGTYVAQEMLTRHNNTDETTNINSRQSIQSLVILNGPVIPEQLQLRFIQKVFNSPFGWIASQFTSNYLFKRNFSPVFGKDTQPSPQALADDWFIISQQEGQKISHKLIHYYNESLRNRERWLGAIKDTEIPILSISGLADPVAGKAMVNKYAELFPNLRVLTLESIGHYPHLEDPKSVIAHYNAFVATFANQ